MERNKLGDSYDLVKRFWAQTLNIIAPLYAHSDFFPMDDELRAPYSLLTSVPILSAPPKGQFGILLDPHTGIPLPSGGGKPMGHARLEFIVEIFHSWKPSYLICFDQSVKRQKKPNGQDQRISKCTELRNKGIESFFYESHAPFLFATTTSDSLKKDKGASHVVWYSQI